VLAAAVVLLLSRHPPNLEVRVDPRVELVTTVFRLSGADEFKMDSSNSPYAKKVDTYFAPFTKHPAVEFARKVREKSSIGFDAVTTLAVNLTDVDTLGERIPFDQAKRWDHRWSVKDAREFVADLKSFVKDTDYRGFLASQQPYFAHATQRLSGLFRTYDAPAWIQDFYGSKPSREPFAIVGLLCGGGNYGMSVEFPDGSLETSPIFGASQFDADGYPVYDQSTVPTILHEFSHAYVNPLVRQNLATLKPAAKRFMPRLGPVLASNAYNSEEPVLYETFVRTAETYLVRLHLGAKLAEGSLIDQRQRGFLWTSDLIDELVASGMDRPDHPAFAAILPRLEETFIRLANKPDALYARCPSVKNCTFTPSPGDPTEIKISVLFDRPMRTNLRGVGIQPEGWKVVTPTKFADDGLSFELTVKLAMGTDYDFAINRFGRNLLSQDGYPLLPYTRHLKAKGP